MEKLDTSFVTKKNVKVMTKGPILPLGGIYGPMATPQVMTTHDIAVLLQKRYEVVEVLNNKSEVKLTMGNYNVDLNGDGGKAVEAIKQPTDEVKSIPPKKVEEPKAEEANKLQVNQPNNQQQNNNGANQQNTQNSDNNDGKKDEGKADANIKSGTPNSVIVKGGNKADKLHSK